MTALLDTPVGTVDQLPAISLAQLNESAALLTRVDRKYVLAASDLPLILRNLPPDARVLEIDGERAFAYRSTYLDTAELAAFHGAVQRRRRRWKVRTRTYTTGETFLEVKTRRGAATVKERILCSPRDAAGAALRLTTVGRDFVEASLGSAGVQLDAATLRPTLVTSYRRTTLLLPSAGSRATIDADLCWSTPEGTASRTFTGRVIVETKSGTAPSALDRSLWRLGHRPVSISKYGLGLALLHPELPANRWHRLVSALSHRPKEAS